MLHLITVGQKLGKGSKIEFDKYYWGLAVAGDEIFVACQDDSKSKGGRNSRIRYPTKREETFGMNKDGSAVDLDIIMINVLTKFHELTMPSRVKTSFL